MAMQTCDVFVTGVRQLVAERIDRIAAATGGSLPLEQLMPGKMLRTLFAGHLAEAVAESVAVDRLSKVCAATEMVHTASLCHDDIIDNAFLRRRQPALWRSSGASSAVLIGDLLLCEAGALVAGMADGRFVANFLGAVREVCTAEAEQEIALRGLEPKPETCLRIARQKTGPLFAFPAYFCGGSDEALCAALRDAGYNVGAAYQLADDLVDVAGSETAAGKTLGTDAERRKFTLAHVAEGGREAVGEYICRLTSNAVGCLEPWPRARRGLENFLSRHFRKEVDRQLQGCGIDVRLGLIE